MFDIFCFAWGPVWEMDITNLPTAELEVPLQRRHCRRVALLRHGQRGVLVEVAVADEEPHHREVVPVAPFVHLEAGKVVQGVAHDSSPRGLRRRFGAADGDVHVPHQQADLWSRKLKSIAVRKLRSIAVGQVEGLPVHVRDMTRRGGPRA